MLIFSLVLAACGGGGGGSASGSAGSPPLPAIPIYAAVAYPADGALVGGLMKIGALYGQGATSVAYSIDGVQVASGSDAIDYDFDQLANGQHTISVAIHTDRADLTDGSASVTVMVDAAKLQQAALDFINANLVARNPGSIIGVRKFAAVPAIQISPDIINDVALADIQSDFFDKYYGIAFGNWQVGSVESYTLFPMPGQNVPPVPDGVIYVQYSPDGKFLGSHINVAADQVTIKSATVQLDRTAFLAESASDRVDEILTDVGKAYAGTDQTVCSTREIGAMPEAGEASKLVSLPDPISVAALKIVAGLKPGDQVPSQ